MSAGTESVMSNGATKSVRASNGSRTIALPKKSVRDRGIQSGDQLAVVPPEEDSDDGVLFEIWLPDADLHSTGWLTKLTRGTSTVVEHSGSWTVSLPAERAKQVSISQGDRLTFCEEEEKPDGHLFDIRRLEDAVKMFSSYEQ